MLMTIVRVLHRKRLKIPGFGQTGSLFVVLYEFVLCLLIGVCLLVVFVCLMFEMIDDCLLRISGDGLCRNPHGGTNMISHKLKHGFLTVKINGL